MSRIYAIGETVLDILFKEDRPCKATPGGSMLNAAVTLGRLGADVCFVGEYGTDRIGCRIDRFLQENGVSTRFVHRYSDANTSLALAFLDTDGNAAYQFYKPRTGLHPAFDLPEAGPGDCILFGSFYALNAEHHVRFFPWVEASHRQGALVIYDPNFRKPHLDRLEAVRPLLNRNLGVADVVRASDEDCLMLFRTQQADTVYHNFLQADQTFICTTGGTDICRCTGDRTVHYLPHPVNRMVSTVGAGDTFNAGLAWGLTQRGATPGSLPLLGDEIWQDLVADCSAFSASVCESDENYLSKHFVK